MTAQTATLVWKKIASLFLGLILALVLLEAGIRFGGFVLLSIQEYGNLRSIKQKGAYRILCLGESTTQGQYPHFLEEVLNQRNIGVHFSVIDKGKVATNTSFILSRVESYLTEYRPDMVIAMMGNNDSQFTYYKDIPESDAWLFKHCRAYKFGRILCGHFLKKLQKKDIFGLSGSDPRKNADPEDTRPVVKKADFSREKPEEKVTKLDFSGMGGRPGPSGSSLNGSRLSVTEKPPEEAIALDPQTGHTCIGLGKQVYLDHGKSLGAEASFKKAIELNPKNDAAYLELGQLYRLQDRLSQAEDSYKKAIELNPENDNAYDGLGWVYMDQGKLSQAEGFFNKAKEVRFKHAIERNTKNDDTVVGLAGFDRSQDKLSQDEDAYQKALGLGGGYRLQGRLSQAEDIYKKALEFDPEDDRMLRAMSSLYEAMGKPELAQAYVEKADRLRSEKYPSVTINNYHKLKEILDEKGIKLVCVQYPVRNVAPLKRIFEKEEGVIFVDNERVFRKALKKGSYREYFIDMFAGDFGHCTPKGNELLAQNIADVILKKVFNKS